MIISWSYLPTRLHSFLVSYGSLDSLGCPNIVWGDSASEYLGTSFNPEGIQQKLSGHLVLFVEDPLRDVFRVFVPPQNEF
jgi:hypothetical protein